MAPFQNPDKQSFKEQKYFERLNITTTSISKAKELIKNNIKNTLKCWDSGRNIEKQTFHMIGPAGVGKTQICYQIAKELGEELSQPFGVKMVKAPVLSRDDFIIPFPIMDNEGASFKMLYSDFVPKNQDTSGLFIIDECGRGDHQLQQLMWQVQNECKIHLMDFPKKWFVIATDNPDDREYSMDILEDAAGLRRMLHLYIEVSAKDFLSHATKSGFHRLVTEFIETHPEYVYDFESQKLGAVYANPASWEKTSNILWGFETNGGSKKHISELDILLPGLLNINKARLFTEFIRSKKNIKPKDIFDKYSDVRDDIIALVNDGDNASLSQLMNSFLTFLSENRPTKTKKATENMATFLTDIPVDTASILVSYVYKFPPKSDEFKYFTSLHIELMKCNQTYQEKFYNNLVDLSKKAGVEKT
jgi:hypothetical protein